MVDYIPENIKRVYPWIMWQLWKNKNQYLFDGIHCQADYIVNKAVYDANEWFMAQYFFSSECLQETPLSAQHSIFWKPLSYGQIEVCLFKRKQDTITTH